MAKAPQKTKEAKAKAAAGGGKKSKRSGPRVKPETNFQICAFSINQPTTKFLKKFPTTRFGPES